MTEREHLERTARWLCEQLIASIGEAVRAAENHEVLLEALLPSHHPALEVIDYLISSLKEARKELT